MRRQLGYMLAREQMFIFAEEDDEEAEALTKTVNNGFRSELFRYVAADLDIQEAKTPDDVYKADLANRVPGTGTSAKQNLASTFVNGWLNCGFGNDKLMQEDGSKWIYKVGGVVVGLLLFVRSFFFRACRTRSAVSFAPPRRWGWYTCGILRWV